MPKRLKPIVIGNWKMNPLTAKEAEKLLANTAKKLGRLKHVEVVACPPSIFLDRLKKVTKKIPLGAQDAFIEEKGAYTGSISPFMLYELGLRYTILGHSERRSDGEDNSLINKKVKKAISAGLYPILCVGESDRDSGHEYLKLVQSQIEECLQGVNKNFLEKVIIAYEPVWAIGSTAKREATPEEFQEMFIFIRKILSDKFGIDAATSVRIIYGGSVHPENVEGFVKVGQAQGFLVGRDSLDSEKFSKIVKNTDNAVR